MSFEQLVAKVEQAENALEAHERRTAADFRQLRASWRQAWTPGRIVVAGAVAGFLVGRARPLRAVGGGGGVLQLLSALAGLFAGGSAQAAAGEAAQAAQQVDAATQGGDAVVVATTLAEPPA